MKAAARTSKKIFNNTSTKTTLTEPLILSTAETNTARRMQQQGLLKMGKHQSPPPPNRLANCPVFASRLSGHKLKHRT